MPFLFHRGDDDKKSSDKTIMPKHNNDPIDDFPMKTFFDPDVYQVELQNNPDRSNCQWVGALDQGTSSTRFVVFTHSGRLLASAQVEHVQIFPPDHPGWHEHDPLTLIHKSLACMRAVQALLQDKIKNTSPTFPSLPPLRALGITNQRETTLAWNRETGVPYYNAIVWDDTRTATVARDIVRRNISTTTIRSLSGGRSARNNMDCFRTTTGLPVTSYFAGTKVKWLVDNVPALASDLQSRPHTVCFGTVDTWLVYQLTGKPCDHPGALHVGGQFCTDVSNASRWLFLDIHTQQWSADLVNRIMGGGPTNPTVPLSALPKICPSSHIFGTVADHLTRDSKDGNSLSMFQNVPIAAVLGDQQAALFGQTAFLPGQAKNTYGTGMFLMMNTGEKAIPSTHGLLTTIAYQIGTDGPVQYALEGSVSHAGSTIQWLRDQLGLIDAAPDTEDLSPAHNDGLYLVPAFGGLFCPHWRADARACIVGMTASHHKGHVCRAALEAAAYQTREVLEAMQFDSGVTLDSLKVDGGMAANRLLMQFQSDMLRVPVIQPVVMETTSLGAAFCAGLAVGVWKDTAELAELWAVANTFTPQMDEMVRQKHFYEWKKAVSKSLGWVEDDDKKESTALLLEGTSYTTNAWSRETALTLGLTALVVGFLAGRWQRW